MPFLIATAPGRADHPNEDFAAVTDHCAVLLDGVSGPPDGDDGCIHGVARHVRRLGGLLLAGMDAGLPLRTALSEAIAATAALHTDTCDLTHRDTPSATVVAVRLHPAHIPATRGAVAPTADGGGPPRPDGASAIGDVPGPAAAREAEASDGAPATQNPSGSVVDGGGLPRPDGASVIGDVPGPAAAREAEASGGAPATQNPSGSAADGVALGGGPPRPDGASANRDVLGPAADGGALGGELSRPDGASDIWDVPGPAVDGGGSPRPGGAPATRGAPGPAAARAGAAPGGGVPSAVGGAGWLEYLVLSDSVLLVADPRPLADAAADPHTSSGAAASARRAAPDSAAPGHRGGALRETDGVGLVADTRLDVLRADLRRRGAAAGQIRTLRGVPGGFWTAGADPRAADEALTGTARLDRFALMTDGATRAVEVFGDLDWGQAFSLVSDKGPAALIERVRALEDADPQGRAHPRGKVRDDATVVSWVPENLAP
ncbi:hypothetical protein [Nocardiopsis protaetiae]|uniref:hypothetical protein n=1 Tax=Nocardiopsis protaetiae TaxID=3382270 RepID=UPI00387A98FE